MRHQRRRPTRAVGFPAPSACHREARKSLGQTVNEYFCAFQFNSLGFQMAIANHAIATLSQ
jgi:hypothetical protein